jgi:protoheme IX farnesyltransferase
MVDRLRPGDLVELTKPRIVLMVMLTVAVGFWMASPAGGQGLLLFHLLFGTALVAAGVGVLYLTTFVNALVAALAAATLISYVFFYTPLKRHTSVSTLIGAVPGALPIAGGWAAATGTIGLEAWVLFWILFLWQLPHFLALGWLYREDYARADLKMVSAADVDGKLTFLYASLYAAALLPVSLIPAMLGMTGAVYFVGAGLLSAWFLFASGRAATQCSAVNARRLFRLSLAYLPLLLVLMVVISSV